MTRPPVGRLASSGRPGPPPTIDTKGTPVTQEAHLNIIRDKTGNYFVEVAQGADRITITPALASAAEAGQALQQIRAATLLPVGKSTA